MTIYIASDHAAIDEKNYLIEKFKDDYNVMDCGTYTPESCDYPDYAQKVAKHIQRDKDGFGILLCGSGIGMSIACNFAGVYAARCHCHEDAVLARQHNHARVICIGTRQMSTDNDYEYLSDADRMHSIIKTFLSTKPDFDKRHIRRVSKIQPINLFQTKTFTMHSGAIGHWKIECDALSQADIETLCLMISERMTFGAVHGIPTGAIRIAKALEKYKDIKSETLLIVDDVLTTGGSMEEAKSMYMSHFAEEDIVGVVLFSRVEPPWWVSPVFQLWC